MKRTRRILPFLVLALATVSWAQDQGGEFHWSGKLDADKVVEIKNVNGTVDALVSSGDQVEVTAEKSGPRSSEIKIVVEQHSDGVTICAIYPYGMGGSTKCGPGTSWHSNNVHGDNNKVHFVVHLPKNLRFSAQTVNGNVNAEDLGRFVRATSVNGSVHVSTASWAEVKTVNGSIEVRMGSADWSGTLKIESVNGSVKLEMPDDLNAEVKFSSVNGRVSSDFPITISGGFVGHSARGTVGKGGRDLVVETVNGSMELKKGSGI